MSTMVTLPLAMIGLPPTERSGAFDPTFGLHAPPVVAFGTFTSLAAGVVAQPMIERQTTPIAAPPPRALRMILLAIRAWQARTLAARRTAIDVPIAIARAPRKKPR